LHQIDTNARVTTLRASWDGSVSNGSRHTYDVFVSDAHADDEKPSGSVAEYGWVTTLAHNLNAGPNHYPKDSSSTISSSLAMS
jgi:hypothetical protein